MEISEVIKRYMSEWLLDQDSNTAEAWNEVKGAIINSVEGLPSVPEDTEDSVAYIVHYQGIGVKTGQVHSAWMGCTYSRIRTIADYVELGEWIEEQGKFTDVIVGNLMELEG